jgi:hypothetical protein
MRLLQTILYTALPALTFACATTDSVTTKEVTDTKSAISAAEGAGAEDQPQAALHLKLARDQVKQAERLINDDKDEEALLVLARAESDAKLALALTQEAKAKTDATEAMARIEELRKEAR